MINIKGIYQFEIQVQGMFLNQTIKLKGENLITFLGESFFINRWINNEFEPIDYIVLGKGSKIPQKKDIALTNETVRKKCNKKVDLKNKTLNLTCQFSAKDVQNTTEIGVLSGNTLISHDVYQKIDDVILGNTTSLITLNYAFTLETGGFRNGWEESNKYPKSFYITEPNDVIGVINASNRLGYSKEISPELLKPNSFYYDSISQTLYVRTEDGNKPISNQLIIQTR